LIAGGFAGTEQHGIRWIRHAVLDVELCDA
jgi:hypothetical protein